MMPNWIRCLILICALPTLTGAACQSAPVTSCAGFAKNALSPEATVAVIRLDPDGARRVIGNDRNGERLGCWD